MLEAGAPLEQVLPRLKRAATSAQQEARFAVLALSSAGGSARFDSALRRYVEVLTADGELEVELDVDPQVRLAPDEQIEVFRIVQEGLGNARRHAGASHVDVSISQRGGRRVVTVSDDGVGFDETAVVEGQGVANMRSRAEAIDGAAHASCRAGRGTAIEVVLVSPRALVPRSSVSVSRRDGCATPIIESRVTIDGELVLVQSTRVPSGRRGSRCSGRRPSSPRPCTSTSSPSSTPNSSRTPRGSETARDR